MMWQFWVDRGGTFTDIIAKKPDGTILCHKVLSENPEHYRDAAVYGIKEILGVAQNEVIPEGLIEVVRMGTTVATNALLERKGDRTLFVTTRGFGDVLRIGYQNRPHIFDLHIVLPEMLYERVLEAQERVDVQGTVLQPLDEAVARKGLQAAYDDGTRAVAIALMHGYQYPAHEKRLAALAREVGFTQISVSHEVSPLMKLVPRGDTTVMDAYLSPILQRYVQQVAGELDKDRTPDQATRLMFMQSSGGLASAEHFRGKDAILSGPAGGVVGMVSTARQAGFDTLIGFDMGGTSTDVTHYAGEFERSFETEVAGVRIRVPMMSVNTVAAGGGSILHFDGARYRVGPDSAGADPGPACYGRGGPLTVTDCNVILGKINPAYFPRVFGPDANQPLDQAIVQKKFTELAQEIARATGGAPRSPEEVAAGFLRIAVANITNAIKKISVQRGYDLSDYTLNCFGGAGGQHACLVADALRMKRVFLHPYAGVLSAFGIGLADVRSIHNRQVNSPFTKEGLIALQSAVDDLASQARAELVEQQVGDRPTEQLVSLHLRYAGSHQAILVELATLEAMQANFESLHQQRYGFCTPDQDIIIDALTVEAVAHNPEIADQAETIYSDLPLPHSEQISMVSADQRVQAPLYQRTDLHPGHCVDGPAIIVEPTGTNVVEAGWRATMNEFRHLILTRVVPLPESEHVGTDADPVMLEVFNNLFMSVAEQMGATLANTAYSVNIKERYDFSCAIFDPEGGLVANAPHIPVHLGSMGESVRAVVTRNQGAIQPGDVFMLNDPFVGGTHLPDITVVTPVFDENGKDILFYVASRGHHADIGGKTPGSAPPDSRTIDEEGVVITNFKLLEHGQLREQALRALLGSGRYPCRNPDQNVADLKAQIAANETGVREIMKAVSHFGRDVVHAYMLHVQDNAEESVRRVIGKLKDSHFSYALDNGSVIHLEIRVKPESREAVIDFTGTTAQVDGNYNAPASVCKSAVLYAFRTLVADDIPLNEGCLKPLKIITPEGSFINPLPPAAVMSGNTEVSQAITEALYGALGILAGSQGTMNNFVYGDEVYQNYETICGGTGAGPDFDGASAVHSHMTNTRMTDAEVVEWRYPVRVEEFSIRHGSGGAGQHHGGDGVVRKVRFLRPMTATVLTSHRSTQPFGVGGAEPGQAGKNYVVRSDGRVEVLGTNDEADMQVNDLFVIETPGGGGYNV
ncbi:hydantoinase B/oxoprolinase family protein [Castellaniella sp.]|uniref:hydantoinase B/oxoprolinase family protein n=1 Tax=Castellaniella sp. TaxID=1955812 RepID=UPI003A947834